MNLVRYIEIAFLVTVAFPYTQFLVTYASYNQPYVYILALLLIRPRKILGLDNREQVVLISFAIFGVGLFIATSLPSPSFQEYKYLLNYCAPIMLVPISCDIAIRNPKLVQRVFFVAILVWFCIALVQQLIDPNFMTSLVSRRYGIAYDFVVSGRGVLSLAPEPTHHGLHMIVLAAIYSLVGGKRWVLVLCAIDIVFLAKSSGAVFALSLAAIMWGIINYKQHFIKILASIVIAFITLSLMKAFVSDDSRIMVLIDLFMREGIGAIGYDYSSNARLGGVYLSYYESFMNGFIPHGMSHENWIETSRLLYHSNLWLIALSQTGFPSGFGLVLYQAGILAFPMIVLFTFRVVRFQGDVYASYLAVSMIFVFNMQYYLSTPGFSVFWGVLLGVTSLKLEEWNRLQGVKRTSSRRN